MNVFPTKIEHNILEYILGGNSYFCVRQKVKDDYKELWYKIKVSSSNKNMFFVYLVKGNNKSYMGYFYKADVGQIRRLYIKNKGAEEDPSKAVPIIRVLNRLGTVGTLWQEVEIISDGRCSRCGKRITDFESLAYGLGPTCRKKVGYKYS